MGSFLKVYSSEISGWDFNLHRDPPSIYPEETLLDYNFVSNTPDLVIPSKESFKKEENESTGAVLKLINQVLLNDDLENRPFTIENSTLEAAEKSFYDVLNNDMNKKHNTLCSCSRSKTNDLFDIVSDLQKYKSSICSCHTASDRNIAFDNMVKYQANRLVRVRSLNSDECEFMQGRSNKHIEVCPETEEYVLREMFDNILSLYGTEKETRVLSNPSPKTRRNKLGLNRREAADMKNLLTQCMTCMASSDKDDTSNASRILNQIRTRASISGDGTQRLAHYFADGLEARLAGGKGLPQHKTHNVKSYDADVKKASQLYLTDFPFMQISYYYANQMILTLAEKREPSTIHVIHYGIMHGLQWPPFIRSLSKRPGRPIKLRITGIDLPRTGFRPDAMVERTKRRLASICERFNVPFEYNGFVKNWDTITVEDVRIEKDEMVVVNCLYHFMYLPDDTMVEPSQRDIVLRMINWFNPDLFIHVIVNGTYNSPFFISRFREALFHFTTLFHMFDVNLSRENPLRMVFEKEMWGREITNIVACEGIDRLERPETYKEWHIRMIRAGFKQLPLNKEIVKQVKCRLKSCYHKDFFVEESGDWLLDGWKGRPLFGLSSWAPLDKNLKKETAKLKTG